MYTPQAVLYALGWWQQDAVNDMQDTIYSSLRVFKTCAMWHNIYGPSIQLNLHDWHIIIGVWKRCDQAFGRIHFDDIFAKQSFKQDVFLLPQQ